MAEGSVQTAPGVLPFQSTRQVDAPSRELYIDRLRSVMTVFVVLHHTAITYGAPGGWYYNELHPSGSVSSLLLTFFVATNQAYFMGFFFLLAGYFTPPSLERKGYGRFLGDRFLRLGLPLLAYIFFLNPLTAALLRAYEGKGFWPTFAYYWQHAIIGAGPLWFAQALLMFSLGYCAWRALAGARLTAFRAHTHPGSLGRPFARERISGRHRRACHSPVCSSRRERHRPATGILCVLHLSLCRRNRRMAPRLAAPA